MPLSNPFTPSALDPNISSTEFGYLNNVTSNLQTQLDAKATLTSSISNGDTTHAPSGDAVYDALAGKADGLAGVKVYRALLTQSSTDAPAATVLENTLGGTLVWTREDIGWYVGTLAGAFSGGTAKFWYNQPGFNNGNDQNVATRIVVNDANSIYLYTYVSGDSTSDFNTNPNSPMCLEILVYP